MINIERIKAEQLQLLARKGVLMGDLEQVNANLNTINTILQLDQQGAAEQPAPAPEGEAPE